MTDSPASPKLALSYGHESSGEAWTSEWARRQVSRGLSVLRLHRTGIRASADWPAARFVAQTRLADKPAIYDAGHYWYAWGELWAMEVGPESVSLLYVDGAKSADPAAEWVASLERKDEANVLWFRMGSGGIEASAMPVAGRSPVDAFYPWLQGGCDRFWAEYIESEANVLLLMGPPGTGKTSFLRGLLRSRLGIEAWVTYDSRVQQDEALYTRFADPGEGNSRDSLGSRWDHLDPTQLAGRARIGGLASARIAVRGDAEGKYDGARILVLEDSDRMLSSRDRGNDLMARILNLSDGLVSLPKRKIVFSTNLPSLSAVDEALLRPGRCFAAVNFRRLTGAEARAAAEAVGRDGSALSLGAEYTLAQALNSGAAQAGPSVRKVGFV